MRPVQKLLYIGDRAMGALTFRPPERIRTPAEEEPLEVARLVAQARVVIEGRPDVAIPEMLRVGASAGGARPKALILWSESTGRVRSGFATPGAGDDHWILKFDGVGELGARDDTPKPFNRIEYAYARLAAHAGIDMPETRLLEQEGFGHLLVKRFDRMEGRRVHMHSLGGMQHVDYNIPAAFSYESFLRTILRLTLGYPALEEAFRRAVFNVVAVNQDDHVKNFAFLMSQNGEWRLAPAYDLTFARGQGYTRTHQMTLNGKSDAFTRADLLAFGGTMGVNRDGRHVIDEVIEAMSHWREYAAEAGVPADRITAVSDRFRLLSR
jgi:serine/threonine-protein kinase HipA